jgi:hypothetical protein
MLAGESIALSDSISSITLLCFGRHLRSVACGTRGRSAGSRPRLFQLYS